MSLSKSFIGGNVALAAALALAIPADFSRDNRIDIRGKYDGPGWGGALTRSRHAERKHDKLGKRKAKGKPLFRV